MEEAFFDLTETFLEAMATVQKLRQFQPPLGPDLRSSIVAWAVRLIVSGSPGPNQLELQERAEKGLQEMLEQLLREDPSAGHVVGLLEVSVEKTRRGGREVPAEAAGASGRETSCRKEPAPPIRPPALLQGLRKKTRAPRWEANPGQPWKEGYLHLRHVGEDWVREGSLVLLYSVLGRARQLLEEEEEDDLRMSLSALLYKL
uniref:Uncharacterized protein n=1 Tax=Sphaerodactylus townsendi TaxID=933632 RepID=A0ACB8EV40_9SAUR